MPTDAGPSGGTAWSERLKQRTVQDPARILVTGLMEASANPTEARTMCVLCGTMIRASASSGDHARVALEGAWEAHLHQRHGAELASLEGTAPLEPPTQDRIH